MAKRILWIFFIVSLSLTGPSLSFAAPTENARSRNDLVALELDYFENTLVKQNFPQKEKAILAQASEDEREKTVIETLNAIESEQRRKEESLPAAKTEASQAVVAADRSWEEKPRIYKSAYSDAGPWISDWNLSTGYRNDFLQWSIADTDGHPNILSELTWEDLHIAQIKGAGKLLWKNLFRFEGTIDYGTIIDGKNQDSDYLADDRGLEFSRSNNNSDGDNVFDYSFGAGVQFSWGIDSEAARENLIADEITVGLLAGYSYSEQNLRITDGSQTIPATGAFSNLNSTYQTQWDGPWVGFEFLGKKEKYSGLARGEYHWVDYYAEADWNLRSDFQHPKSFEHTADGRGISLNFEGEYFLNDHWGMTLDSDVKLWRASDGIDRTFFTSGAVIDTKLNEVNWTSYAFLLGARYHFGD